jgi:hypothetical protein
MAIISIPTSIGGVSIPGLSTNGPLGLLYSSKYQGADHQYPRDLGSLPKGHIVKFTANEIIPSNYTETLGKTFNQIEVGAKSLINKGIETYKNGVTVDNLKTLGENFVQEGEALAVPLTDMGKSLINETNLSLTKRRKLPRDRIALYIPDTMAFGNSVSYGKLSTRNTLLKVGSAVPVLGKAVSGIASILESDVTKLALATQGLALNPVDQMLFDGIDFRTYQMAFTFTPYSREEAKEVREIIKTFRKWAAPRIMNGAAGMFFEPPATFTVEFKVKGNENAYVPKVAESVIESIDVNYSPNGWAAHDDGSPVQTLLTINFREIALIDRNQVIQGY